MSIRSIGKKWAVGLVLASLLVQQPLVAFAQSRDDLEKRIQDLERKLERLEKLERAQAQSPAPRAKAHAREETPVPSRIVAEPETPPLEENQVKAIVQDEIKKQKPLAGWKDGFFIESANGDFKFKARGYVQTDARWFPNTQGDTGTSQFYLRRVRPIFEGTVYKYFDYKIMPDFGNGQTVLQDAYSDIKYIPEAKLRAGKFKFPLSLERLQGGDSLIFIERSLSNNLAPNRDVGFQLFGEFFEGALAYQLGIFNGTFDNGNVDGDVNSDKDGVVRIFSEPWRNSDYDSLRGLGVGIAGSYGDQNDDPIDGFKLQTAGRSTIFKYATGTQGAGIKTRFDPQLYYFWGPFGSMGEFTWSSGDTKLTNENGDTTTGNVTNYGGFLQASYVVTGEDASFRGVVPINNFDPYQGRWGAFEVAARASWVNLDNTAFSDGFSSRSSSVSSAVAYTIGVNWYFNKNFKVQANYERTDFDRLIKIDNAQRSREDVLLARLQISY